MGFEKNFKVLEDISKLEEGHDQEVLAREIATNRPVLIHFLAERAGPDHTMILRKVLSFDKEHGKYVLESGTFNDRPYIVTKILPGNASLRKWVNGGDAAISGQPHSEPDISQTSSPPASHPAAEAAPGEFTRMFRVPTAGAPAVQDGEVSLPPKAISVAAGAGNAGEPMAHTAVAPAGPGEFTRLFAVQSPVDSGVRPASDSLNSVLTPPLHDPGSTRLAHNVVRSPGPGSGIQSPDPSRAPAAGSSHSGEFTQFFGSPVAPRSAVAQQPPASSVPSAGAGDFTRQFQIPVTGAPEPRGRVADTPAFFAQPTPPSSSRGTTPGGFTQMFQTPPAPPAREGATDAFAIPRAPAPAPYTPNPGAPGEYTRAFATPTALPEPKPAPTPAATSTTRPGATAPKNTSVYQPLILALSGLIIVALLLVIFFTLRR